MCRRLGTSDKYHLVKWEACAVTFQLLVVLLSQLYGEGVDCVVTLFTLAIRCSVLHHNLKVHLLVLHLMCELPVIYGMAWVGVIECLFFPELCVFCDFASHTWGQGKGREMLLLYSY